VPTLLTVGERLEEGDHRVDLRVVEARILARAPVVRTLGAVPVPDILGQQAVRLLSAAVPASGFRPLGRN
jgi:hypothetical protein